MENTRPGHPNVDRRSADSTEDCAICLDKIQEKKMLKCLHSFCSQCIDSVFRFKPACPICNTYHGVYTGNQPEGTMTVTRSWQRLPGFEHCGCIPEHPNPGVRYSSTSRTAYLPASEEGEKVLKLLRKAFDRRLVFTIGQSATTGLNNVITWNDIHHKTNMAGGPQSCNIITNPQSRSTSQTSLPKVEESKSDLLGRWRSLLERRRVGLGFGRGCSLLMQAIAAVRKTLWMLFSEVNAEHSSRLRKWNGGAWGRQTLPLMLRILK
ncbi:hypothetical protein INR49_017814 [Caranx melampygus]|nr:hypothetical protein INR49_017814 [Caranx melampygus]